MALPLTVLLKHDKYDGRNERMHHIVGECHLSHCCKGSPETLLKIQFDADHNETNMTCGGCKPAKVVSLVEPEVGNQIKMRLDICGRFIPVTGIPIPYPARTIRP